MTADPRRYARGHVLAADAEAVAAVREVAARLGWGIEEQSLDGGSGRPAPAAGIRFADPVRVRLVAGDGPPPDAAAIVRALAGRAEVWLDEGRGLT